ncbi:unnamed protein product [Phytophthora lilii]|uniref:Unnamed protein product n=1 Tax=Phytophthora lilii TaxID=2077276 RepID=A0A9W6TI97_9STRA|nr:unnamed protein product [Phytophthora lilii]
MADPLLAPFAELCGALRGLQEQVEQLARVHEAVDDFNSAFGAFQGAMALHASCLTYPKTPKVAPPPKEKQVSPAPQPEKPHVSPSGNGQKSEKSKTETKSNGEKSKKKAPPAVGMKRHGKVEPHRPHNTRIKRRKTQVAKTPQSAWTWERRTWRTGGWRGGGLTVAVVDIREKIPRKYQSPAELKKLENIVLYLKNRHCAMYVATALVANDARVPTI